MSKTYDPTKPEERVSFPASTPETKEFDFYKTGTDDVFVNPAAAAETWYPLPYQAANVDTVAYVLCAPVDATDMIDTSGDKIPDTPTTEYTLLVETGRSRCRSI